MEWWNDGNPIFQPNIFEIFPSRPPSPQRGVGKGEEGLFFFRDRGFIQFEGIVKGPDCQFRIFGIDDAGDFDL